LITLFAPLGERWLFYGKDSQDLTALRRLEDRLLTRNDLSQFLEMILAAVCDRLQAPGAYIVALTDDGFEQVVTIGKTRFDSPSVSNGLVEMVSKNEDLPELFRWGDDILVPLQDENKEMESKVIGLLGISMAREDSPDDEQLQALRVLSHRAALALQDRQTQTQVFESLENLAPQVDLIQRLRAAGRYNENTLLTAEDPLPTQNVSQWVREALTHYWGGPKLTDSPLMRFKIVQSALEEHEGNYPNALRAILRQAIEKTRPEGERRFTGEWILYNILEMKFLEGRKVREIAMRLAMSEADLYRKQRIAIEEVAKAILDMETQARNGSEG
jgi:ribosomal protein S7